MNLQYKLQL